MPTDPCSHASTVEPLPSRIRTVWLVHETATSVAPSSGSEARSSMACPDAADLPGTEPARDKADDGRDAQRAGRDDGRDDDDAREGCLPEHLSLLFSARHDARVEPHVGGDHEHEEPAQLPHPDHREEAEARHADAGEDRRTPGSCRPGEKYTGTMRAANGRKNRRQPRQRQGDAPRAQSPIITPTRPEEGPEDEDDVEEGEADGGEERPAARTRPSPRRLTSALSRSASIA